jgi:hypothetical protein
MDNPALPHVKDAGARSGALPRGQWAREISSNENPA